MAKIKRHGISPERAKLFPELIYIVRFDGQLAIVKPGELGSYDTKHAVRDREHAEAIANHFNEQLGVTKAQRAAALAGSMFGWDLGLADPACYDEHGNLINNRKGNRNE